MFENAIEKVSSYTRPIHTISRTYDGNIFPGTATMFFVNDEGVAITCKHVATMLPAADEVNNRFNKFRKEREALPRDYKYKQALKGLELKYLYKEETTVQLKTNFINCFDRITNIDYHLHPTLDLAILKFKGFSQKHYLSYARFIKDSTEVRQGKFLCRLGYPFPEFNNFRHDPQSDDIEWTQEGLTVSPTFPIEGMVTRFLAGADRQVIGIEMSTPGLRGQSGGPLFDAEGTVFGMQFATNHLHLGFDIKGREILDNGKKTKVSKYPFLNVGLCIHAEEIKKFLRENNIKYFETD